MRPLMVLVPAFLLVWQPAGRTETPAEARVIVEKAIKAMGLDKLPKDIKGSRTKAKGTLEIMGMTLGFSQTVTIRMPDQFKDSMELEVANMKIPVNTVFDGKKGWVETQGKVIKLDDKINNELKEV